MPSFVEVIDLTILATAIAGLVISVLKLKKKKKAKQAELNRKDRQDLR